VVGSGNRCRDLINCTHVSLYDYPFILHALGKSCSTTMHHTAASVNANVTHYFIIIDIKITIARSTIYKSCIHNYISHHHSPTP
jgi:hypothetical protein